ncbi:hypothetical protein MMPV_003240 [Pyropia vietnamensis]
MYLPRCRVLGCHLLVFFLGVAATPQFVKGDPTTRRPPPDAFRLPTAVAAASPPTTPSTSDFKQVPLLGGLLHKGDYVVAATLGGQPLRLKADTSSGSVVVARAACEFCPTSGAKYDDAASPAAVGALSPANATVVSCSDPMCGVSVPGSEPDTGQCSALECKVCSDGGACCAPGKPGGCWFGRVGSGRAGSGRLGRDVLALVGQSGDGTEGDEARGGVSANVTFAGLDVVEGPFLPMGADGLLGLGLDPSACEPSCTRPFAAEVGVNDGGVGLCVNVVGGALTFGGVNESHLAAGASLSWFGLTPVADDDPTGESAVVRKWLTPVSPSMRVGTATIDAPKLKTALWTSSTPFVGLSSELFLAIFMELQKYCDLDEELCSEQTWFRPQSCVRLPDGVMEGMPNFTFTVGGPDDSAPLDVVLTASDYLLPYPQGSKLYHCLSLVAVNMEGRDEQLILGASVLRRYVSYWDRAGRRLGLGPASGACGSSVPVEEGLISTDGGGGGGGASDGGSAAAGAPLPPAITADSVLGATTNGSAAAAGTTPGAATTPTASGDSRGSSVPGAAAAACAAHDTCSSCAADASACAYNLRTGACVARDGTSGGGGILPYPLCHGHGCICAFAGGGGGAVAVGRLLGAAAGLALAVGVIAMVGCWWARRRRPEGGGGVDPYAPVLIDDEASDEGFDILGRLPR